MSEGAQSQPTGEPLASAPADAPTLAAPAPTWPIAVGVWMIAYPLYELADYAILMLSSGWPIRGLIGSQPAAGTAIHQALVRISMLAYLLGPLLLAGLLVGGIGLCRRRRWAIWQLGGSALVYLAYIIMRFVVSTLRSITDPQPRHLGWLGALPSSLIHFAILLAVVVLMLHPRTASQFRQWVEDHRPVRRPIWPVVIGWLSLFVACHGLGNALFHASSIISYILTSPLPQSGDSRWSIDFGLRQLPLLCTIALAVPGIAAIKARPSFPILHVLVAIAAICSMPAHFLYIFFSYGFSPDYLLNFWYLSPKLLAVAYPLFLLVWFARPKVRRQLAVWRQTGALTVGSAEGERTFP